MKIALAAALAASSLALSGCITSAVVRDLSPEAKRDLALKFIDRCGGTVSIGATGSAGQLGGAVAGDFRITGTCPTPETPKAAPLSEIDKLLTPQPEPPLQGRP